MALIDIVKHNTVDGDLCFKFDSDDLRMGTQLVVHPAQTAIFVKGGKICDIFEEGTYTLDSNNIPLLNRLINLPFGSESPFQAEVWFINRTSKLDLLWGTPNPIQIEDPRYHIIVPVRAHGQYGIRVAEPRVFLETLIGSMSSFSTEKIDQFFKGRIISATNTLLSQQIVNNGISILDINSQLMTMSEKMNIDLNAMLGKYGIEIVEFAVMSINFPPEDESVKKLKEAKDLAARINITGRDIYQMERSFDVLDTAAANESTGGQFMGMGVGLGAGLGVGSAVGNLTGQFLNTNPPPLPGQQAALYHVVIGGQQVAGLSSADIARHIANGTAGAATLAWTPGMSEWKPLGQLPAFAHLFTSQTPPPLP